MLKIALCDDDAKFTWKFETMLLSISEQEHIHLDIDVFADGKELVEYLDKEENNYDLIFLDIEMRALDGLAVARHIRETDDLTMLIYVSSHKSYALEAFDVQPFQFLVKPVDFNTLHGYFMKAYKKLTKGPSYFFCQFRGETESLMMGKIVYFESNRRIINIYMADGSIYKFYGKLNDLEERLKQSRADFWRIHQSYLINVMYIDRISFDKVELKNHKILYISEDRRKMISEKYSDHIKENFIE